MAKRLNDNIAIVTADELQTINVDGEESVCKINFLYNTVPGTGFGAFGTLLVDLFKTPSQGLYVPFDNSFFNSFITSQYGGVGGQIGKFIENGKKFYSCVIGAVLPDAVADFQINLRIYSNIKRDQSNDFSVELPDFEAFYSTYSEEDRVYNVSVEELFVGANLPVTLQDAYINKIIAVSVEVNGSAKNPKFFFCGSLILTSSSSTTSDGDCGGVRVTSDYILTFAFELESRRMYSQVFTMSTIGVGVLTPGTSQISHQNPNGSWTVETFPVSYCTAQGSKTTDGDQYVLSSDYDDSLLSFTIDENQVPIMYASEQKLNSVFDEGFVANYNVLVPDNSDRFQLKYSFNYEDSTLPFSTNLNNLPNSLVRATSPYALVQNSVFNFSYNPTFPASSGVVTSNYVLVNSNKNKTYIGLRTNNDEKSLEIDKYRLVYPVSSSFQELGAQDLVFQRASRKISFPTATSAFLTGVQFFTGLGTLASFVSVETRVPVPGLGVLSIEGSNYPVYKTTSGDFIFT